VFQIRLEQRKAGLPQHVLSTAATPILRLRIRAVPLLRAGVGFLTNYYIENSSPTEHAERAEAAIDYN
jgi:hypothetical protein